eukprot:TRINITY_DN7951_c0_g1_i7.p1 TRINITY_DN7951_c0_g1~~TRINITY_DN7951_c0_g1_i7.p1  ORF type:complete len:439 (-),score=89.65 TRINITY_DN7951_c0_g1_i7:424-1674(-)
MGCTSSQNPPPPVPERRVSMSRRRLSVGEVDASGDASGRRPSLLLNQGRRRLSLAEVEGPKPVESVKSVNWEFAQKDILQMLKEVGKAADSKKFSIGSSPDNGLEHFADKEMQTLGDSIDVASSGLGYTCRKGLKPEGPNQDSWSLLRVEGDFSIYGVYDGHGGKGHDVSNFVKDAIPKLMVKDSSFKTQNMKEMMVDVFKAAQGWVSKLDEQNQLDGKTAGTTATVVYHDHRSAQLLVSHVADSTCVIGEYTDASKTTLKGKPLTRDHKPELDDEKERIEKNGGRVHWDGYANHRIYNTGGRRPGIAMSRCLGDLDAHAEVGLTCEPEVTLVKLSPLNNVLLLCSDGVWEFVGHDEAVQIVSSEPPSNAMKAAENLATIARDRWMVKENGEVVDDITVILVHLTPPESTENETQV